ncbi:MAG: ATP-binding cassette domain-containing protein [Clostridiales bacterium]|nr:ATP-binding cassette domain-containing protein [Clostridiales bacterium]
MLILRNVCKAYGELSVLKDVNLELASDGIYCLMAPSGSGKTTLLRLILGLERPDFGEIIVNFKADSERFAGRNRLPASEQSIYSAVFQEDRLCEDFSALDNLLLTSHGSFTREQLTEELCCLLPEESIRRPVRTLSGGMKRRVAILRAMLAPSQAILMDEPFSGLDEDMRHTVIRYILEHRQNRLLLVATHQEEDVGLLGARRVGLRG